MRRPRNLGLTKEKILTAARRIFADKGPEGARIGNIAQTAGVSKGMIFYIFKNKLDLYQSVLEIAVEEIVSAANIELGGQAVSVESFINLGHRYFDIFANNPDFALILLREIANGGPVFSRIKESNPDYFARFRRTSKRIDELVERGAIKKIDSDKYQLSVMLLTMMIVASKPLVPLFFGYKDSTLRDVSFDEWKAFITDLILNSTLPDACHREKAGY